MDHRLYDEWLVTTVAEEPSARSIRIRQLIGALRVAASENTPDTARTLALKAVSPLLDYSSLVRLSRFNLSSEADETKVATRLAILGGPTTNQLRQLVELFLDAEGIKAEIYEAEYNLFRQEIISESSSLDDFRPQIIFLATGADQVLRFPEIGMNVEQVSDLAEIEFEEWMTLWRTAESRWGAIVVQNNFEVTGGSFGHYSLRHPAARENYLERLNRMFAERAPESVVLHDLRSIVADAGSGWRDRRLYHEFKIPFAPDNLVTYSHSVASLIKAILGRNKKVLVLDLDNTIWGGVIGDLGPGGIRLGEGSGEGEAFLAFQRFAKELQQRGVLLAVCSKNDEANAKEPFEARRDMILKLEDISCFVANWEDKANNIRKIADYLELKMDSFVFVDDNPVERALVRQFLPEVAVPELPDDPSGYVSAVARHRYFEAISLSFEDVSRTRFYSENARRKGLAAASVDLPSFHKSLQMSISVEPINGLNIERVTQLINKSNQFNLTTRRFTLAQVREFVADPNWITLTFSLKDRLGDNGLISVLMLFKQGNALAIDTWVMSCRVLQRGVENFTRNLLVDLARSEGQVEMIGTYIPTAKNGMVRDHYPRLGFEQFDSEGDQTHWKLVINDSIQPLPHFIEKGNC